MSCRTVAPGTDTICGLHVFLKFVKSPLFPRAEGRRSLVGHIHCPLSRKTALPFRSGLPDHTFAGDSYNATSLLLIASNRRCSENMSIGKHTPLACTHLFSISLAIATTHIAVVP